MLVGNIKLNGLLNVKAFKIGLSNYNGVAKLLVAGGSTTGTNTLSSKFYSQYINLSEIEEVEVYKLDTFAKKLNLNKITGIKIDVEGHDLYLLEGAKETLCEFKPFLIIEVNELTLQTAGCTTKQLFDLLKSYDYVIHYFEKNEKLSQRPPKYIHESSRLYYDIVCFHKSKC